MGYAVKLQKGEIQFEYKHQIVSYYSLKYYTFTLPYRYFFYTGGQYTSAKSITQNNNDTLLQLFKTQSNSNHSVLWEVESGVNPCRFGTERLIGYNLFLIFETAKPIKNISTIGYATSSSELTASIPAKSIILIAAGRNGCNMANNDNTQSNGTAMEPLGYPTTTHVVGTLAGNEYSGGVVLCYNDKAQMFKFYKNPQSSPIVLLEF